MYIVMNTIQIEPEFADKVVTQFVSRHTKDNMAGVEGFIDFELLLNQQEDSEYKELVVLSRWIDKSAQKNWLKTQSFKNLHPKAKQASEEKPKRKPSGIINNKITEFEVVK
ncbi:MULTISPECIES: antibiotic biosynthesis monooxygenase [unclassified Enterococcus]|uniref:antibiotic biosynthesis monooxygenase n=1 Tax=unclassified Enterococcus TaxID=2608891 RepID=UPI00155616AD|nr:MULTISPECIES: antibiotic biosynthesis monooxygenase [unclassified Enterococcus]MBS7578245.1 antibiotic biosynthesis monooxygenase [Enterococcus sp. MMGLQ5-2]MBS7585516.1 antibiotic biosynthesis monooxygenase [Enterococcus sp. MMGLQ5-1]NPD13375.1 hypothetical protein [Enterococcus sp. MMGLQ5-1]NPD38076.1 hypothetical protein [Enterococcus sp. MMGLQ5-2]